MAAVAFSMWGLPRLSMGGGPIAMTVYKDPNCGCCEGWVDHMKDNGFKVKIHDTADMESIRKKYLPDVGALHSCHTGLVGAYVIEGHVPAADVKKFLKEKPEGAIGLTIPGMPMSAPGMDADPFEPYIVLRFDKKGKTTEYVKHDTK
jgi:hypothetical protein